MRILHVLLWTLSVMALAARVDAVTLYGATAAGAAGELYILDPATGAVVQDVGPLNDANSVNYPITGLAFHPTSGVFYGSTGNSVVATAARLVTINPTTGLVTVIGSYNAGPVNTSGTPATMADLSFDAAGNLYGVGSIGGPHLYSINTDTGQATMIGNTGLTSTTGGGLAISSTGVFYGTPTASRFGTYDSTTSAFTNIANPTKPAAGGYGALSFDGGVLYGLNVGSGSPPPTHLVTLDTATGTVADLGLSVPSLDAIAFQPGASVLAGDYNNNNSVDAADYVLWRKYNGTNNPLGPNDLTIPPIPITTAQYDQWKSNFGNLSAASGSAVVPVPEPSTLILLIGMLMMLSRCRATDS